MRVLAADPTTLSATAERGLWAIGGAVAISCVRAIGAYGLRVLRPGVAKEIEALLDTRLRGVESAITAGIGQVKGEVATLHVRHDDLQKELKDMAKREGDIVSRLSWIEGCLKIPRGGRRTGEAP